MNLHIQTKTGNSPGYGSTEVSAAELRLFFRADSWFDKERNKNNKIINCGRREMVASERLT